MAIYNKIFKAFKERPTFIYPYVRQTWKFYQTRLLYNIFKPHGIILGKNVRIQAFSSLRVQLPSSRIEIGDHGLIWEGCRIEAVEGGCIEIGTHVEIVDAVLFARSKIIIGNNVGIGENSYIQDSLGHPSLPEERKRHFTEHLEYFFPSFDNISPSVPKQGNFDMDPRPITIGDNVTIYRNCLILRGVSIGKNSIIGSHSVVTKNIPPNSLAVGNPAIVKGTITNKA